MPSKPLPPPEECANCGSTIPRGAKACPSCGADERTGWRETSTYDGLDLPEAAWQDDTDAGEAKRKGGKRLVNGIPWYWWIVGATLLVLTALAFLGLR